ncbi:hypothetical protein [Apibacter sp. HY039]|uniref:hypothetical protein n=1 Tax=Apibacter sp. HY039 TaxID=2501476 RepID=UPI000FEC2033|nr:hypothetical protein [Apibacter sp. HY039]
MNSKIIKSTILILSIVLYFFLLCNLYQSILGYVNNNFTYPLDDSYIHLAIAKNIAEHGVWGINSNEFSSASSSPLFTVILSLFLFIFGNNSYIPLILNILFSLSTIYLAWYYFKDKLSYILLSLLLISIIIWTPLPGLTIIAMEHIIHAFLTLFYLLLIWEILINNNQSKKIIYLYYLISFLLPISRYEGLFIIIGGNLILFFSKKFRISIIGVLCSILSISLFGLYFIYNGGTFFPYSVIIKTSLSNSVVFYKLLPYKNILLYYIKDIASRQLLICFIFVLTFSFLVQLKLKKNILKIIIILSIGIILHVMYSKFGWLNRYEAFLFPSILCILFYSIQQACIKSKNLSFKHQLLYFSLFILLIYPSCFFTKRSLINHEKIIIGAEEIHNQQYQTALFIQKYYPNKSVAINDIGYPSYLSNNTHIVDIYGLGNTQIALAKKNKSKNINPVIINEIKKNNVKAAFIYKKWFSDDLYKDWVEIGYWEINHRVRYIGKLAISGTTGGACVYIFSTSTELNDIEYLKNSLKEFNKNQLTQNAHFTKLEK